MMRKIEEKMWDAVFIGVDFKQNNTEVRVDDTRLVNRPVRSVYLHGNHIADYVPNVGIVVNKDTLSAYPTRTTMSRLRALGVDVCTRKGVVYLDGKPI